MLKTLALTALLATLAAPAFAQPAAAPTAPMVPAAGDAPRPSPSPAMAAARTKMREQCAADIKTYCADAQTGGGALMQCIRDNAAKMSDGCKGALADMRAARSGG